MQCTTATTSVQLPHGTVRADDARCSIARPLTIRGIDDALAHASRPSQAAADRAMTIRSDPEISVQLFRLRDRTAARSTRDGRRASSSAGRSSLNVSPTARCVQQRGGSGRRDLERRARCTLESGRPWPTTRVGATRPRGGGVASSAADGRRRRSATRPSAANDARRPRRRPSSRRRSMTTAGNVSIVDEPERRPRRLPGRRALPGLQRRRAILTVGVQRARRRERQRRLRRDRNFPIDSRRRAPRRTGRPT